ncbi:MAG: hypothetical protein ACOCZV_00765 [Nanoarchaeota archaeon]
MVCEGFAKTRLELIDETKRAVAGSFSSDVTVIQLLTVVDELILQTNSLSKRLRDWHGALLPEVGHVVSDHERFCRLVADKSFEELKGEFCGEVSMAASVPDIQYAPVRDFASFIVSVYDLKADLLSRLETVLSGIAPNLLHLCGASIASRLISSAGSLRKLACFPSSTIQLLGAEKALFRHLKTGARSPKHGFIYSHPLISHASRSDMGRVSRALADKISLCSRLDYFGGEFKADSYYEELKDRFSRGDR